MAYIENPAQATHRALANTRASINRNTNIAPCSPSPTHLLASALYLYHICLVSYLFFAFVTVPTHFHPRIILLGITQATEFRDLDIEYRSIVSNRDGRAWSHGLTGLRWHAKKHGVFGRNATFALDLGYVMLFAEPEDDGTGTT
tara:strand:+ start:20191 stop:20622 length:432 start_codon:yes stop_codon:yes gene_type:complete